VYPVILSKKYYKKDFESVVTEFEFIKKIIIGEIIFITGYFALVQADQIFSLHLGQSPVLSDFFPFLIFGLILCISGGVSRMALQIARRQFRFYLSNCISNQSTQKPQFHETNQSITVTDRQAARFYAKIFELP